MIYFWIWLAVMVLGNVAIPVMEARERIAYPVQSAIARFKGYRPWQSHVMATLWPLFLVIIVLGESYALLEKFGERLGRKAR